MLKCTSLKGLVTSPRLMDDIFVASYNEITVNITSFLIINKLSTVCSSVKKLPAKNEW